MTTESLTRDPAVGREIHAGVTATVASTPLFAAIRTDTPEEALRQARALRDGGVEIVEITFTIPDAIDVVRTLLAERSGDGPPWIGMGTVTTVERARRALAAGAEFLVTPNVAPEVAEIAHGAGVFLVIGALTPTEMLAGVALGADLIKAYPLPPVGGPTYLATVRLPLPDIPILAAGGFGPEEIAAYRAAGAVAFGLGAQLLGADPEATRALIANALDAARS